MQELPQFPDIEDTVMALLESIAPTVQSTGYEFTPPLIQVRKTGGTQTQLQTRPTVEVYYFGTDYPSAKEMAARGDQIVEAARASTVHDVPGHPNGVYIDKTEITATAREISYQDPEKRRKTSTYNFTLRRPRSV